MRKILVTTTVVVAGLATLAVVALYGFALAVEIAEINDELRAEDEMRRRSY